MAQSDSNTLGRFFAGLAAAASVLLAAAVLLSQTTVEREIIYTSPIAAPSSGEPEQLEVRVSPLEVRAAVAQGRAAVAAGCLRAAEAVPEVPWNEYGLAQVPITPEMIRFDAARERYVADLDDGRLAILTLRPYVQDRLQGVLDAYPEPGEAVVAIDPATGRVIALVDDSDADDIGPGLARHSNALAASTFKVITGAALLAEGVAEPSTEVCFSGGSSGFDESDLTPNEAEDTQCLSLTSAMAWSANLVFARLADRHLTPDTLQGYAEAFGFNMRIPFEMPLERSIARIPTDRLGFTRAAAGFYNTWMSPLHGAMIQAAIANDGRMLVPTIVERIEDADGAVVYTHQPTIWREPIDAETAQTLSAVQADTCRSGTARADFGNRDGWPPRVQVFGKTGTLSNRSPDSTTEPDPLYVYRWFTGHASYEDAEVAVGALVINTPRWHIKGTYLASEAVLASLL